MSVWEQIHGPVCHNCSSDRITVHVNTKVFSVSRCELQISQSPAEPCGPRSPLLPLYHPPAAGGSHCYDVHLHHLLPVCRCPPGCKQHTSSYFSLCGDFNSYTLLAFLLYSTIALLQVLILLYVASLMVQWLWRRGLDPDDFSIPYLTALGDLLGTGFLALSFRLHVMVHSAWTVF